MSVDPPEAPRVVTLAILVVTDEPRSEEPSVAFLDAELTKLGHRVLRRLALVPSADSIETQLRAWVAEASIDVILILGGVGLGSGGVVPEAMSAVVTREIPGFGERVRAHAGARVGLRAYLGREAAGVATSALVFAIGLSPDDVRSAWEAALGSFLDPKSDASLIPLLNELSET